MDSTIKVAVVRGDRRRGAVAEALALIAEDVRERVSAGSCPVVVPNLDNPARPWTCTHRDTLSAAADAVYGAGAASILVAGGRGRRMPQAHDRRDGAGRDAFEKLGYRAELWQRPAAFLDLDRSGPDQSGESPWTTILWGSPGANRPAPISLCTRVAAARCRVALGVFKTHSIYRVGLGLTDLTGVFHADGRLHPGHEISARAGLSRPPGPAACLLTSWRGGLVRAWLGLRTIAGGMRLTASELRWLADVEQATRRMLSLAALDDAARQRDRRFLRDARGRARAR